MPDADSGSDSASAEEMRPQLCVDKWGVRPQLCVRAPPTLRGNQAKRPQLCVSPPPTLRRVAAKLLN